MRTSSSGGIWTADKEVRQICSSSMSCVCMHTHTHRRADLAAVRMEVGNSVPAKLFQVPACLRLDF